MDEFILGQNDLVIEIEPPEDHELAIVPVAGPTITEGSGALTDEELQDHINDPSPHPAWDDGTDFVLFYENAKV